MTIRELFQKIDGYNEIAEIMKTDKVELYFQDCDICSFGTKFETYSDFRKFVKREYVELLADAVLKFDGWQFETESVIPWRDGSAWFCPCLTVKR